MLVGNWVLWADSLETAAKSMGVWPLLVSPLGQTVTAADGSTSISITAAEQLKNDCALQLIKSALNDSDRMRLVGEHSAYAAWECLKAIYARQTQARQDFLKGQLWSTRHTPGQPASKYSPPGRNFR